MGRLLGLGAAIGGGYSVWHYCFAPLPDPPLRSGAAQEIARFMEANKKYWDTDASTFSETPAQLARMVEYPRPTDGPCFCVTRNVRRYNGVPMLRVTTFLPNVSVDEMVPRMLEKEPRKRWDQNYKFFEEFAELPVPKEVADMRHGFVATARHWCGHVLASATLEKVGVLPRAFLYERIIARRDDGAVCATFRGLNDDEKDVITATTVRHSEFARETLPLVQDPNLPEAKSFAGLLRDRFFAGPAADSQEAIMYWQELLLIPVRRKDIKIQAFEAKKDVGTRDEFPAPTGVASVLFAAAYEFFDEGNPFTSGADRLMYHPEAAAESSSSSGSGLWGKKKVPAKSPEDEAAAARDMEEIGTLMVMTSCNDAKMRPLPRMVERYGSKKLTMSTVEWLMKDIKDQRAIASTKGN